MNKIAQYTCFGIAGILSCTVYAVDSVTDSSPGNGIYGMMLAETQGMERRDDRRDDRQDDRGDRQDCRQEEGVVGHDKRDCKQDARQDDRHGNDDDDDK
jgi:hypothetical protein